LQSFRLKTLCITDTDRETEWSLSGPLRSRLGPRLSFLFQAKDRRFRLTVHFFQGERMGGGFGCAGRLRLAPDTAETTCAMLAWIFRTLCRLAGVLGLLVQLHPGKTFLFFPVL